MATIDEIAAQLERQLAEATAKIDDFVASQSSALSKAVMDHEHIMRELEASITRQQQEEAALAGKSATLQDQVKFEQRQYEERQAEITKLEAQMHAAPVEVDATRAAEAAARAQLEQQKQEYERREAEVRFQLNELTKGIAFYKRLGLDFEKINDDRLRLVFTQIDAAAPDRKFAFNVRVTEADVYEVDACEPPVPGLRDVVAELNTHNDFSRFMQTMRAKFKEVAGGGAGGYGNYSRSLL